jgi:hypothetical protein
MVARAGTNQRAVVHRPSLPSQLTTVATPPMLEIRRRIAPAVRVRTPDRQILEWRSLKCCIPPSPERSPRLGSRSYIARPRL